MPPPLSAQVRSDIESYILRGATSQQIHQRTFVSVRQINRMKRNMKRHATTVAPKAPVQGRPRILGPEVETALLEYLDQRPCASRNNMCRFLCDEFDIVVAERTMSTILRRLGWIREKVGDIFRRWNYVLTILQAQRQALDEINHEARISGRSRPADESPPLPRA